MGNFLNLIMSTLKTLSQSDGPSKSKKENQESGGRKNENVTISDRKEKEDSVTFILHEKISDGVVEEHFCLIEKEDYNPWVRIGGNIKYDNILEFFDMSYSYNVPNYRWKDSDASSFFEHPKLVTKALREEWQKVYGKLEPREKTPSQPVEVDIKVNPVSTEIEIKSLKRWYKPRQIEGSAPEPYLVDMNEYTCTCPDFIKVRSQFPVTDARRICKHLGKVIRTFRDKLEIHGGTFVEKAATELNYHGLPTSEIFEISFAEPLKGPQTIYVAKKKDGPWIDVMFFSEYSRLGKYGYNLNEKRWSRPGNPFPRGDKQKYNKAIQIAADELDF